MHEHFGSGTRLFLATCGVSALLSVAACNSNGSGNTAARSDADKNAPAAAATTDTKSADRQPINLTGCLQKDGSNWILTEINRPAGSPVASGSAANSDRVEREQMKSAEHAYRLAAANNTKDDDWNNLVGKQVRVSGNLVARSDLNAKNDANADRSVGTAGNGSKDRNSKDTTRKDNDRMANGNNSDRDREKIDSGDLAKVDVSSMEKVSEGCGSRK